jgi:hypothetical protein
VDREGAADFAVVGGVGAALIGERAEEAVFGADEFTLKIEDEERVARAGAEFLELVVERLAGEVVGGAIGLDAAACGFDLAGGGGDRDGDVLFEADDVGFGLAQAEFGGAGAAASFGEGQRNAHDEAGGVGAMVVIGDHATADAEVAVEAAVAIAADEIDLREDLHALGGVVGLAFVDAEFGGLVVGALGEGALKIGGGVDRHVGNAGRFDDEGLGIDGKFGFADELAEAVGGVAKILLGEEDRLVTRGGASAGLGDVAFGHAADAEATFVFGEEAGGEFAGARGDAEQLLGVGDLAVGDDGGGDGIDDGLAEDPVGDATVGFGDAETDEIGTEAEAAEERLRDGDAAEGGEVVVVVGERTALIAGAATDAVVHAPRRGAFEGDAVVVGFDQLRNDRIRRDRAVVLGETAAKGERGVEAAEGGEVVGAGDRAAVGFDLDVRILLQGEANGVVEREGLGRQQGGKKRGGEEDYGAEKGADWHERKE